MIGKYSVPPIPAPPSARHDWRMRYIGCDYGAIDKYNRKVMRNMIRGWAAIIFASVMFYGGLAVMLIGLRGL